MKQSAKLMTFIAVILLFTLSSLSASPVRVGFFAMDGYHMIDQEGNRSGYGYELLQLIGRYTPYTFEYIGYDESWADMQEMLAEGKLDIVTSAAKTPEREQLFEVSRNPVGTNHTILTVRNDSSIRARDYSSYEGMRVGLLRSSTKNASFERFASDKAFSWTPCFYDEFSQMEADLQNGSIDAIVSSSLRDTTGEKIIERLDRSDFYIIAPKGDRSVLDTLDAAIDALDATDPGWKDALMYRSYMRSDWELFSLTDEETAYLEETTLKVLMCPDRKPYSFFSDGTTEGIMPRVLSSIAEKTGLKIEYIMTSDREDYLALLEEGDADIILDIPYNISKAEDYGYRITEPYMSAGITQITSASFTGQIKTIATMKDSTHIRRYLEKYFPQLSFRYYDSIESCIEAIDRGDADATCLYSLTAQDLLNGRKGKRYASRILSDTETSFSIGARSDLPPVVIRLLDRTLSDMQDFETVSIIMDETMSYDTDVTFTEYIYRNPAVLLFLILCIGLFIAAGCIAAASLIAGKRLRTANSRLSEANTAKREFLAKMSHDMRTPMNAIMGFTGIAMKSDDRDEINRCLEKISQSSDHLLNLINDVLDISRIEGGAVTFTPVPTDICTVVDSVLSITQGLLTDRHLDFLVDRPKRGHCTVFTDGLKLREILVNLLSNAIKFTDDGGKVIFSMGTDEGWDDEHVNLWFKVRDTGCGMSAEFLPHVFDEFAQEDDGARTRYSGTGLGMAISKQYAILMGGDLTVKSRKGEGTAFTLTLPVAIADPCDIDTGKDENQVMTDLRGRKVLIAEDNDLNAEIATVMLSEQGMSVTRAVNGEEAVRLFTSSQEGTFDIILMDIMMPVMDGLKASSAIRSSRQEGAEIPIIAMTANAFAEDVQASLNAGMNGHISKPIDMKEMMWAIQRCLHTGNK
ncbi:MAG: ATP-binding protein [Bullifex sp.]